VGPRIAPPLFFDSLPTPEYTNSDCYSAAFRMFDSSNALYTNASVQPMSGAQAGAALSDRALEAPWSSIPDFTSIVRAGGFPDPVEVHGSDPSPKAKAAVAEQYARFGFAVFRNSDGAIPPAEMRELGARLGLGAIYTPPYLRAQQHQSLLAAKGVALIQPSESGSNLTHTTFQTGREESLHVDGTVAPIGLVQTSFLYCNSSASLGGDTVLFNAVGAFVDLFKRDTNLVAPLLNPRALRRGSPDDASGECVGPVFSVKGRKIVTSFSINATARWNTGTTGVPGLSEARDALMQCASAGSPYLLRFGLESGMGLIMANDSIAHGRTAFFDNPPRVRRMLRTLHTN